jgi:hypothetical protein
MISSRGYVTAEIALPPAIRGFVAARNWVALDQAIAHEVIPSGLIFAELQKHARFSQIEFIIAIRSSLEYPDEDGIWHDDGTRLLAFSLSLTFDPETIEGGRLEIVRRGSHGSQAQAQAQVQVISTPPYGTMIIFATGQQGYEHKINRVTRGERIIIAGWCT